MGVVDNTGMLRTTKGLTMDITKNNNYMVAWDGNPHLTPSHIMEEAGDYAINSFSQPIYGKDGTIKYLLTASYLSMKLTERMNINSMDGHGFNFIMNSAGDVTIYPQHYTDGEYNDLMSYINETPEIIPNESADSYFEYKGERYYAHFEPMKINRWYLMTCAREKDVFADANRIMRLVAICMGALWVMIGLAIVFTLYSRNKSKRELKEAVFYDEMLGIGNANMLQLYFEKLTPEEKAGMAMIVFDIDKFKEFNYIYGEVAGDNLLKYIVRVFHEVMPEEQIFRYVSDNFVGMIKCKNRAELEEKVLSGRDRMLKDIEQGLMQPFDISVGIRRLHGRDTFRRAVSDALVAKGTIKGIHLQQLAYYDESILQKRMSYMEMESDFSRALRDGEFKVYYQPKYDMRTGKIVGAEALVRWVKKDGTIIAPTVFIPCFEQSRQIIYLDEHMLESVCRQMKQMEEDGLEVKCVSVNLSRVHLRHNGIVAKIEDILTREGIDTSKIAFEITESALYEDSIPLKNITDALHRIGCRVDMDDYGVGVSGPRALAANEFDMIKLDKSFIDGIGDERMEAVIQSTIKLSQTLGMEIMAEGVEEKYQAKQLVEWGCNAAQGFLYSKPVSLEQYRRLLKEDMEK